jgi:hypothetical protein
MTLGNAPKHEDLFRSSEQYCRGRLSATSLYQLLHEQGPTVFADESFADLFLTTGRRSVAPQIVATVMILQRFEGLSDREAVERFEFDVRWKYASGVDLDYPSFVHTVLVDMRARLRNSEHPNRIFEATLQMAKAAGLVGRKRVLDSTALYDAVATQDTVTLIRGSIRALLRLVDAELVAELRGVLKRDDDYAGPGKPVCDWDDEVAREALVDALARDAFAVLLVLDKRELTAEVAQAAALIATVVGQDLEEREDGVFAIARRVAPGRVISVVDPDARHGHKTAARGFDGYKGHIALDPDSEIITATEVTAGNAGDASAAETLLADLLLSGAPDNIPQPASDESLEVYGDASYGTGDILETLQEAGIEPNVKVQPPVALEGRFSQGAFTIDLDANTVTCPAGQLVQLRLSKDGEGRASFAEACSACALREKCTKSESGRTVQVHPKHTLLDQARMRQRAPGWRTNYRATRPKVERKLAHLMRRKHGGRRARVRGTLRVRHDFALLAASVNLARLAKLRVAA